MQRVNRVTPGLPPHMMQTYATAAPPATHWRPASCEEIACVHWREGWATVVDERTDLGLGQAAYIRSEFHDSAKPGRPAAGERWYTESRTPEGLTAFLFGPGQRCFAASEHRVPLERPALFLVRRGDWRGNLGLIRRHRTGAEWVEDLHDTTDRLVELHERG